jgi:hypothetical protein
MKKLLLLIMFGMLISSYSYSQAQNQCLDSCTNIDHIFFCECTPVIMYRFTVDSCIFTSVFSVYYCPGPPSEVKININFLYTSPPYCGCCSLTPTEILPMAFDDIIKHSKWINANYLDTLSLGGCITNISLVTPVCWQKDTLNCSWSWCDSTSCCIKHFQICKDFCGIISTQLLETILAVPCDSTTPCKYNIYCR